MLGAATGTPVVGHVAHEECADLLGDGVEALVVPLARVSGATANEHLWPKVQRLLLQLLVVNITRLHTKGRPSMLQHRLSCNEISLDMLSKMDTHPIPGHLLQEDRRSSSHCDIGSQTQQGHQPTSGLSL